jgi:hypothetical protein
MTIDPRDPHDVWPEIESLEWGKDFDYHRIRRELENNPHREVLDEFADRCAGKLYEVFDAFLESTAPETDFSDDRLSDAIYHIVGLGKQAFDAAIQDPALILRRLNSGDFKESFAYSFLPRYRK